MNFWKNKKKSKIRQTKEVIEDTEKSKFKILEDLSNLLLFAPLEEKFYLSLVEVDISKDVYDFISNITEDLKNNKDKEEYYTSLIKSYINRLNKVLTNRDGMLYRDYLVELIIFHVLNWNEYRDSNNLLRYQKYLIKLYERLIEKKNSQQFNSSEKKIKRY